MVRPQGGRLWVRPPACHPVQPKRQANILWTALIARIDEVFPMLCPLCGGQMRIFAFITGSACIRKILEHIGAEAESPRIMRARGPPLWDAPMPWSVRVYSPCRTGARLAKRHQTLRPISASVGEGHRSGMSAAGRQAGPGIA
jgi:hypothetical protein